MRVPPTFELGDESIYMAFLRLAMCRDSQSRFHVIYLNMLCVVDRVRVHDVPYFLLFFF